MNPDTQTVNEHYDGIYENVLLILDMFSLCFANFHMFFDGLHLNRLKMVFGNHSQNEPTGKSQYIFGKYWKMHLVFWVNHIIPKIIWNQRKFDYPYTNPVEVVESNKSKIIRILSLKMGKTFSFHTCRKRIVCIKSNDLVILSSFAQKKRFIMH